MSGKTMGFSFFREANPSNRYESARVYLEPRRKSGMINEAGELDMSPSTRLGQLAGSYLAKMDARNTPGSGANVVYEASRSRLRQEMGRLGRYFTTPRRDRYGRVTGTHLFWRGRDIYGSPVKSDVFIGSVGKKGAKPSDFGDSGQLIRDGFTDKFDALYRAVLHTDVPGAPTRQEREAWDEYAKTREAWEIVNGSTTGGGSR